MLYRKSLAVIIPMYNEEVNCAKCIREVIKVLEKLKIRSKLIVINDGSEDSTYAILKQLKKKFNGVLVVGEHKKNKGYGSALQTGIGIAIKRKFEFCIFMDSDLTNDPKFINEFVRNMSDEHDCIKASRYIKGGRVIDVPLYRRIISIIGNMVAANLFAIGIKDCTNGFRMVRVSMLKGIKFKEKKFSIILEELYYLKKRGARFKEISNVLKSRQGTKSNFYYKPEIFWSYLKYALQARFIFK